MKYTSGAMVTNPSTSAARSRAKVSGQVREVLLHLQQIHSAVIVAVAALRQQNCELDADVSNVLQRSVADRIQDQIERLEALTETRGRC